MARIVITQIPPKLLQDFKAKCALEGIPMYKKAGEILRCYTYGGEYEVIAEQSPIKLKVLQNKK